MIWLLLTALGALLLAENSARRNPSREQIEYYLGFPAIILGVSLLTVAWFIYRKGKSYILWLHLIGLMIVPGFLFFYTGGM
ncbi:MAG: hypothetical protein WCI21_08475 [Alphaproteobacteria bacterium]